MLFTRLGQVLAIVSILLGMALITMGVSLIGNPDAALYLGSDTTGDKIDKGTILIVFGIIIGVLTDISRSAAANRSS